MRKSIAALAVAAGVAGGGAAGALLGMPGLSVAQSSDSSTTTAEPPTQAPAQAPDQTPATPAPAAPAAPAPGGMKGDRQGALDHALQGLIDNGTLTQQQADAVRKALADEMAKLPGGRGPGMGHGPFIGDPLAAAAKALGMSETDLRAALKGGKTIAAVAQDKGVALDTVVAAIVADANTRIDQAVTAGKLTQQQADSVKSTLKERVTQLVQNPPPMPRPHHRGDGPPPAADGSGSGSGSSGATPGGATPQSYTTS